MHGSRAGLLPGNFILQASDVLLRLRDTGLGSSDLGGELRDL